MFFFIRPAPRGRLEAIRQLEPLVALRTCNFHMRCLRNAIALRITELVNSLQRVCLRAIQGLPTWCNTFAGDFHLGMTGTQMLYNEDNSFLFHSFPAVANGALPKTAFSNVRSGFIPVWSDHLQSLDLPEAKQFMDSSWSRKLWKKYILLSVCRKLVPYCTINWNVVNFPTLVRVRQTTTTLAYNTESPNFTAEKQLPNSPSSEMWWSTPIDSGPVPD